MARLSYTLATINTAVPIDIGMSDITFSYPLSKSAKNALIALEFTSLTKRFSFTDEEVKSDENYTSQVKIEYTTVEIDNIDDLKKLFDDNKGKPFALNAGADVDVAFSADRLYVIKQNYDLFGGMTMDDVLKEIAPHLTSECVVSDLKNFCIFQGRRRRNVGYAKGRGASCISRFRRKKFQGYRYSCRRRKRFGRLGYGVFRNLRLP